MSRLTAILAAFTLLFSASSQAELAVGDPAPDFALQGSDGRQHRLADFRGRQAVVLAWFPNRPYRSQGQARQFGGRYAGQPGATGRRAPRRLISGVARVPRHLGIRGALGNTFGQLLEKTIFTKK